MTSVAAEGRPLLNDAEWALLSAARHDGAVAAHAVTREQLFEGARRIGAFDADVLAEALASLAAKRLLRSTADGSVALTRDGDLLAARAPAY